MLPFELTKDQKTLLGELWGVFYEYFNRNWLCYKGFLLYCDSEWLWIVYIFHQAGGVLNYFVVVVSLI